MSLPAYAERIASDPAVCGGRPVIHGTRLRVVDILSMLAEGASRAEILNDFDYITDADITAALSYAAERIDQPFDRAA